MKPAYILSVLLLLSSCVPEPIASDCETCVGDGGGACPGCDTSGDCPGCESCPDCVPSADVICRPDDVGDVPDVPNECPGEPPACPDLGVCAAGVVAGCYDGEWHCPLWDLEGWEPLEVTCDGKDNDCDGTTDGDLTPPAGTCETEGVCEGSIVPVCTAAGTWDCGYDQVVLYEEEEVSFCDGQDNDCDGLTDEEEGTPCLCNPGARICKVGDPTKAQVCPSTGAGWVDEDCPGGTECMGVGECTATGVFQVNVEVAGAQESGVSTRLTSGQWTVVWESFGQDGGLDNSIYYRKLAADGSFLGGEFPANIHTALNQQSPAIAPLPDGRYMIAWESENQFGANTSVVSRSFPDIGPSPYGEILVSVDLTEDATAPSAAAAGPAAVVAWEGGGSGDRDILLRFADATTGQLLAGDINLSQGSPGHDRAPVVVPAGAGFVALWEKGAFQMEIYGRAVGADGIPGAIIEVFSKAGDSTETIRAAGTSEHVLVLWTEVDAQAVAGIVYNADLMGGQPKVTLPASGAMPGAYAVAPDGWGGFVVVWQDDGAAIPAIRLRRWDPDSGLAGDDDEVVVTTSDETPLTPTSHVSVAGSVGGKVLVTWNAAALDGNGTSEVFARFVSIPVPD